MSPRMCTPRSAAWECTRDHSRWNRTWSASAPGPANAAQLADQTGWAATNRSSSSAVTGACGAANHVGAPAKADDAAYGDP